MNPPLNPSRIAASILAADYSRLADEISAMVAAGVDLFHWDIMDGHFVPNISFGAGIVKACRKVTDKIFDVHLMVNHPMDWIDMFSDAGADSITFHVEAVSDPLRVIEKIQQKNIIVGMALNPDTGLKNIDAEIFQALDRVLVMTAQPGFGAQEMIDQTTKIKELRTRFPSLDIMVDGGVNAENARDLVKAGATTLVSGNALFKSSDRKNYIAQLKGVA
jgi:ribulose-phosphate 3-epimerase